MKFSLLITVCLAVSALGQEDPPAPPGQFMDMDPPGPFIDMDPPGPFAMDPPGPFMDMDPPGPFMDMEETGLEDIIFAPPMNDTHADDWMFMGSGSEERFEGDMILTDEQLRQMNGTADVERNGQVNTYWRWPNAVVPYVITGSFSSSDLRKIRKAMDDYQARTCIKFVQRTDEAHYVNIMVGGGCYSYVGRVRRGAQPVSLGRGCVYNKIIQHELMHALGFFHEQSRCDRDDYVTILTQNIQPGKENNFNKYSCRQVTAFGQNYDYDSAMHYSKYAFSRNGQPTIQAKGNPSRSLGASAYGSLTALDVAKLNIMYECGPISSTSTTTTTTVRPADFCTDYYGSTCSSWANAGYCATSHGYHTFMKFYCRESCDSHIQSCSDACADWDASYCAARTSYCGADISTYNGRVNAALCKATCGKC